MAHARRWFKVDMLVIPLNNYDIVLGIHWLQTSNDIVWNFKYLTMKFIVDGQPIELKGSANNGMSLCTMEQMNSWLNHKD